MLLQKHISVGKQTSQQEFSDGQSITALLFYFFIYLLSMTRGGIITIKRTDRGPSLAVYWRVLFCFFGPCPLLAGSLINHNQSDLKSVQTAMRRADNELLCEALEPTPLGSCVGRREALTDHILGLESKISRLFSLHSPLGDHKKTLYI